MHSRPPRGRIVRHGGDMKVSNGCGPYPVRATRRRPGTMAVARYALLAGVFLLASAVAAPAPANASPNPELTRYPYLTDVVGSNATVNFGTDQTKTSAVVRWGQVGVESCNAHTTTATKTFIQVNGVGE